MDSKTSSSLISRRSLLRIPSPSRRRFPQIRTNSQPRFWTCASRNEPTEPTGCVDCFRRMLLFGFYQNPEDLVDLIMVLLSLLNGNADVTVQEEIQYILDFDKGRKPHSKPSCLALRTVNSLSRRGG